MTVGDLVENITFIYEVLNLGPSTVREFFVAVKIPLSYYSHQNLTVNFLDFEELTITASYEKQLLKVNWTKDGNEVHQSKNTQLDLLEEADDYSIKQDININENLSSSENSIFEQESTTSDPEFSRKKREIDDKLDESDQILQGQLASKFIFVNCKDPKVEGQCVEAKFFVKDFKANSESIKIKIDFNFKALEFGNCFKKYFIRKINLIL